MMNGEGTMKNFKEESEETSIDWRGRPSKSNKHGGMSAAVFVLGTFLTL